ncbi:MAG: Gam protein [Clostridiaceae bacterium]|nr:Gam protein [Clostridiaceae bacterium]
MKKNYTVILFVGLIFVGLVISNLYFFKKTMDLNKEINRIFELEAMIDNLKAEHQDEIDNLNKEHENAINLLTNEYTHKVETVIKALNAFEYELEEFYKNKHILQRDYLENLEKIREVREEINLD